MASSPKLIARKVPVQVIQLDMINWAGLLRYPTTALTGDCFFTEKVLWGEIWLKDLSKRGTLWRGYVRNGELYLDETSRVAKTRVDRPNSGKTPSLVTPGKYKVWLDAFVRLGDFPKVYAGDVLTLPGEFDPDTAQWHATGVPASKHWPVVNVPVPKKGEAARMEVPSSRYHWVYRLSRLVQTLDVHIRQHEQQVSKISTISEMSAHVSSFMAAMAGLNQGDTPNIRASKANIADFAAIRRTLHNVVADSQNLINYGQPNASVVKFRKHVNNLAELLWQMVQNDRYQHHVAAVEKILAEEHQILLHRLGDVFNKIPKTCDSTSEGPNGSSPVGESFDYGRSYAQDFVFPYFDYAAKSVGRDPIFKIQKPTSWVKWLDSTRKYGYTMVNYASIYFVASRVPAEKIEKILGVITDHLAQRMSAIDMQKGLPSFIDRFGVKMEQYAKEFEALADRLAREGAKEASLLATAAAAKKRAEFANMRSRAQMRSEAYKRLQSQVDEIDKKVKEFEGEIDELEKTHPVKLTDRLKQGNGVTAYKAVYWLQGFEIAVKGIVAFAAWSKFVDSWGKQGKGLNSSAAIGADAFFKSSSFMSSVFQFSGLAKVGQATQWYKFAVVLDGEEAAAAALAAKLEILSKTGKGLAFLADAGSAGLATYELFYNNTYGDDLLERYMPGDACGMYAWHLVIWGGKVMTAIGSGGGMFKPGKLLLKNPLFVKLQAIGYMLQFTGELGEMIYKIGKSEKAHCMRLVADARHWNNISKASMTGAGFEPSDLFPESQYSAMVEEMEDFEWRDMNPDNFQAMFGVPLEHN